MNVLFRGAALLSALLLVLALLAAPCLAAAATQRPACAWGAPLPQLLMVGMVRAVDEGVALLTPASSLPDDAATGQGLQHRPRLATHSSLSDRPLTYPIRP